MAAIIHTLLTLLASLTRQELAQPQRRLSGGGNVGINNTGPAYKLHVGDGTGDMRIFGQSGNTYSIGASNGVGNGAFYFGASAGCQP